MADYGQSDAFYANQAAGAYATGRENTLKDVQAQIDSVVAKMNAGIISGMTEGEKAGLDAELKSLKDRYAQAISETKGSYQFAQDQSASATARSQEALTNMQNAQRALAAQTLGLAGETRALGGYSAAQADSQRQILRDTGADMAALGGSASVPDGMRIGLPALPGGAVSGGLIGVDRATQDMFSAALNASRARAITDIENENLNLGTAITNSANAAARAREQAERDKVQDFYRSSMQGLVTLTANTADELAKLRAAAAGADTRSGKAKANAALALKEREAAIDYKYAVKKIMAQMRAQGGSDADRAQAQAVAHYAIGSQTPFGAYSNSALTNAAANVVANSKMPWVKKQFPGTWTYANGSVIYNTVDAKGKTVSKEYKIQNDLNEITALLGELATTTDPIKRKLRWDGFWNSENMDKDRKVALALVLGKDALDGSWYLSALNPKTSAMPVVEQTKAQTAAQKAAAAKARKDNPPPIPDRATAEALARGQTGAGLSVYGNMYGNALRDLPIVGRLFGG